MADDELKKIRARVLKPAFNPDSYEYSDRFEPGIIGDPATAHTVPELLECLKNGKAELEGAVMGRNEAGKRVFKKYQDAKSFLEDYNKGELQNRGASFRESFDNDDCGTSANGGLVGDDFIPSLGGPFFKQLYQYDYVRMHNLAFWALHHDPVARAIVNITRDFTLGRGFSIDCDNDKALAYWRAFEEVNDLPNLMDQFARELCVFGECMLWKLPNNDTSIGFNLSAEQKMGKGLLPRYRLIDPSVIWEIVTWPEDIQRVMYYVWVSPTQYQIYSGIVKDRTVPGSKFIFQTIPAEDVIHVKVNSLSGEKRGRSDFFPVLGYMKRLRDSVNYSVISMQKQSAWSMDTTIEGSQADVDAYVEDQQAIGTIPPAGSEFIHTDKIKREFLTSTAGGSKSNSIAFEWCISMIATGVGIPINYFGTHMSGGQTRASAIVATEPVNKKWEMRQQLYERVIKKLWNELMKCGGLGDVEMEVTFPDLITQDRSQKLKDLALAESQGWVSKSRAAGIAAKELGITNYDYDQEAKDVEIDQAETADPMGAPLTDDAAMPKSSAVTGAEKVDIAKQNAQ